MTSDQILPFKVTNSHTHTHTLISDDVHTELASIHTDTDTHTHTQTSDDAHAEVEPLHAVAEGCGHEPRARQEPASDHHGPTAILIHQDAADWSWQ